MRLTQFGTYTFPLFNKRDLVSQGDSSGALLALTGGEVYDGYQDDQAPEASTDLVTSFEIIEATAAAVQTQYDLIRALRGKVLKLWAHFPDGTDRWVTARLAKVKMERRREYIFYQPVELTFEVARPGWNGTGRGPTWALDAGEILDSGLFLDYDDVITLDGSPKSATIANGGNRMQNEIILVFRAAGNPISAITFKCGPVDWTFSGTVAAGKTLTVDCRTRSIRNDGVDAYNLLTLNAGHTVSDWCQLEPGNNAATITYTCAGNATTLDLAYYDGWE